MLLLDLPLILMVMKYLVIPLQTVVEFLVSTVGNPLVDLNIVGIDTLPTTYKRLHWYQENAFAGLGTDAWLSNYAIGIGSTQLPNGTRLAAGNVQITENDLTVVRNINASGISSATAFADFDYLQAPFGSTVNFSVTVASRILLTDIMERVVVMHI